MKTPTDTEGIQMVKAVQASVGQPVTTGVALLLWAAMSAVDRDSLQWWYENIYQPPPGAGDEPAKTI